MLVRIFLAMLSLVVAPSTVYAQASFCGDPPPVANEDLKGEIEGKAQFLSRLLGEASLSGEIQTSRTEIFSKYRDDEQSRSNAYFEYQFCVLIFNDQSMSTKEKIEELKNIRREFSKPAIIEGRLDGHWQGETKISRCKMNFFFDLFVEGERVFGSAQQFDENRSVQSSSDIEGELFDGVIRDLGFVSSGYFAGSFSYEHDAIFVLDGDFQSGRIKKTTGGRGACSSGTYTLKQIR